MLLYEQTFKTVYFAFFRKYDFGNQISRILTVFCTTIFFQRRCQKIALIAEQIGASGATALILISDVVTGAGFRWAHLRQAGVPPEEFSSFARAALELIRNRLFYVIRPVVDRSRYASITGISKAIASSEGYVTYSDYETSRDKARGMAAKSRMMQVFVRTNIRNQARSAMKAESLIRNMA